MLNGLIETFLYVIDIVNYHLHLTLWLYLNYKYYINFSLAFRGFSLKPFIVFKLNFKEEIDFFSSWESKINKILVIIRNPVEFILNNIIIFFIFYYRNSNL